jgi:hypothetical protein
MAEKVESPRRNWIVFVVASLYLAAQAVWRFTVRAGEWPSSAVRTMEIAVDVAMSFAIIALYLKFKDDPAKQGIATVLVIIAALAMLVIFGIRFSSNVGWATGHRLNWTD